MMRLRTLSIAALITASLGCAAVEPVASTSGQPKPVMVAGSPMACAVVSKGYNPTTVTPAQIILEPASTVGVVPKVRTVMLPGRIFRERQVVFPGIDTPIGARDRVSFWMIVAGNPNDNGGVQQVHVSLCVGDQTVQEQRFAGQGVEGNAIAAIAASSKGAIFSAAHDIMIPHNLNVDAMVYEVRWSGGATKFRVPIERYVQKTTLRFPLAGAAIAVADHDLASHHRGEPSQWYAYDFFGIDKATFARHVASPVDSNDDYVGWGTDVLAPADGKVVDARGDIADNLKPGESMAVDALKEKYGADEHRVIGGNFVVIDHGNAEFSFLGHLQKGSVIVQKGDRVTAGQRIGRMGNSGNSSAPHLHYHLMVCERAFKCSGLPSVFSGLSVPQVPDFPRYSPVRGVPVLAR